jgi:hypothetical protein
MKHLKKFNENESAYPEFADKYAKMKASLDVALVEFRDVYTIDSEGSGVQEYPNGCLVYRIELGEFGKMSGVFKKEELYKLKEDYENLIKITEACQRVLKKMFADGFTQSDVYISSNNISFQIK